MEELRSENKNRQATLQGDQGVKTYRSIEKKELS